MELYLQGGYGMMSMVNELVTSWGGGGVILSPRDLTAVQIERAAKEVAAAGGDVLIDPQCFTRAADHKRLRSHKYYKEFRKQKSDAFIGGDAPKRVLQELATLANKAGITRHILPGLIAKEPDEAWFLFSERMIEAAKREFGNAQLLATLAVSSDVLENENSTERILERAGKWPVHGFYVVPESPSNYLVDKPFWIGNLLTLLSGLKLAGKTTLVGYSSHQSLCLATANVDAIASGSWLNVRSFPMDKFFEPEPSETSRRATWYYCPQALSEYKLTFLDVAWKKGILQQMRPAGDLGCNYADSLFTGTQPTLVKWKEREAFRHYLTCLRSQCNCATLGSYDETRTAYLQLLDQTESLIKQLRKAGIYGGDRDFHEFVDINRSALSILDDARGPLLRRSWR